MHELMQGARYGINAALQYCKFWRRVRRDSDRLDETGIVMDRVRRKRVMIVVSTGRTGTAWLAHTLATANGVCACHEPLRKEQFAWVEAFNGGNSAKAYAEYRLKFIEREMRRCTQDIYIESNGSLRRHIIEIKAHAPNIYFPHIIRDGRDLINSVMNRKSLTMKDPVSWFVGRKTVTEAGRWGNMDKFQKICWLWKVENEYMLEHADRTIRFEDMMTSYPLFNSVFCAPMGMRVSKEAWERRRKVTENTNKKKVTTGWGEWSGDQKAFFRNCCGNLMERFNYL